MLGEVVSIVSNLGAFVHEGYLLDWYISLLRSGMFISIMCHSGIITLP